MVVKSESEGEEEEMVSGSVTLRSATSVGSRSRKRPLSVANRYRVRKKGMKDRSASSRRIAKTIEGSEEERHKVRMIRRHALRSFLRNILKVVLPIGSDPKRRRRYVARQFVRGRGPLSSSLPFKRGPGDWYFVSCYLRWPSPHTGQYTGESRARPKSYS